MVIAAQIISIFAMSANVLSYQFKKPRSIMLLQFIGSLLFTVNMFMLNAVMGAILNLIGIFRALVYMDPKKLRIPLKYINGFFLILYIAAYVCVFTVFQKEPIPIHFLIEFLPLVGMGALTVGFALNNAKSIRLLGFISSPCWLIYNIYYVTIGGILCEIFALISLVSAHIRYDIASKKQSN